MTRHTSTIIAIPSQADTRLSSIGVTWSTSALGACSYALDCKTAAESWSDRASFPGKRERSAHGGAWDSAHGRGQQPGGAPPHPPTHPTPVPRSLHPLWTVNLLRFLNLACPTPNLEQRDFSRASRASRWEMQLYPVSPKFVQKQIGHYSPLRLSWGP
jgi:hypothetical protein